MTTIESNALIAKFLEIEKASDGRYILPDTYQKILKVKTINNIPFNESLDLLYLAIEKICSIKDLWITSQQFQENGCYVCLFYKAERVEDSYKNAEFSCERNKSIKDFKQAIYEVIYTFCGWFFNHPECQNEIEYI